MAIEIFCVPSCVNTDKGWQVVINYFDLKNTKDTLTKQKPLPEVPELPIGAKIEEDGTVSKKAGEEQRLVFSNFSCGKIISIDELSNRLYPFDVPEEVIKDTKFYIINYGGKKPIVFFCYELFRTFLCIDNRIIPYLFQFDVLESFINKSEIRDVDHRRFLYLELNDNFPKSFFEDDNFLEKYIFILFNNSQREYWKSIQANSTLIKSDFSFNSIGLGELDLVCRLKEYRDFSLVYNIKEINSTLEFPFDELEVVHTSFKDKSKISQSSEGRKRGCFDINLPTSHSTYEDNDKTGSTEYSESISVLPLNIKFDRKMKIKRISVSPGNKSSTSGSNSNDAFPKLKLKDLNVGFNNYENEGEQKSIFLNLTRDEGFNNFDYSEIPDGLVFFSKAVGLLASTLKLNYAYELMPFSNKSSFSKIYNTTRKALIISIQHKPHVYIVEVDSSDNKYISTLMVTNLLAKKDSFFKILLEKVGENNGVWPVEFLKFNCAFIKIKHPKMTKKLKDLPAEEKNDIYIKKLTNKFISILDK